MNNTTTQKAKDFLVKCFREIESIKAVYAFKKKCDQTEVVVLVDDFWNDKNEQIYDTIYDMHKQLDVPGINIVVIPYESAIDDYKNCTDCVSWI